MTSDYVALWYYPWGNFPPFNCVSGVSERRASPPANEARGG